MIVVDTSALMAILLNEQKADACAEALAQSDEIFISAGTLAEALIVAAGRNLVDELNRLMDGLSIQTHPIQTASARRVAEAYQKWGKGNHSAKLNFGDCFAYVAAKELNCSLLYVGDDFSQTDIAGLF